MKILVTGGAGFIGSHVVDASLAAGHQVVVVDDLSTGREENVPRGIRFHRVDIASPELSEVFEQEAPEIVNHQAAQSSVPVSVQRPLYDAGVNILGTINLLEQSARHGVRAFVFASTGGALYGDLDVIPATESHPVRAISPYATSKFAAEAYIALYKRLHTLPYCILRYSNVYGPRQDPHGEAGVVAIFSQAMLEARQPTIFGDGTQTRDFIYVEDVARANLKAMAAAEALTVHISTGRETSINSLYATLSSLTGYREPPRYGPPRAGDPYRNALDPSRAASPLGWRAQTSLEEGLRRTVQWFRDHRSVPSSRP